MYVGLHYLFVIYSNGIICKLIYMCTFLLAYYIFTNIFNPTNYVCI